MELEEGDEIPLEQNPLAEIGPAFVARAEKGEPLVSPSSLRYVQNLQDMSRLIVFDTWVRNCDRHRAADENEPVQINLDNLFLSEEGARTTLAIWRARRLRRRRPELERKRVARLRSDSGPLEVAGPVDRVVRVRDGRLALGVVGGNQFANRAFVGGLRLRVGRHRE